MKGRVAAEVMDTRQVRRAFGRLAAEYETRNGPDQEIGRRLLEHLEPVRISPSLILDLGTGTGGCARRLLESYPKARVLAVDVAPAMLGVSRRREPRFLSRQTYLCGDAARLGVSDGIADMVYSNLTLPWCPDPDTVFVELRRVLSPGGLLTFSTLGPDTLREMRSAWREVDDHHHVHDFIDMHDIGDALVRAGFGDVVLDTEILTVQYKGLDGLFSDLRGLGAGNLSPGRRKTLTGRGRFERLAERYPRAEGDAVSATLEVTYAHAWAPAPRGVAIPRMDLG